MTDNPIVDAHRSQCLCDAGLPGWAAAVCVNPDGTESLWLIDRHGTDKVGDANQRHEKAGRLPKQIRDRIWGDALLCGRATYAGKSCRQRVKEPGRSCSQHCDGRSCGHCRECYVNGQGAS